MPKKAQQKVIDEAWKAQPKTQNEQKYEFKAYV
jgi:hypothetical protein